MITRRTRPLLALLLAAACSDLPTAPRGTRPLDIPAIPREFRGMWIATVANIDWPSSRNLSVPQQQAELRALLDLAQLTGLNAVILQIRSAGDALYPSSLEPWSASFSGTQGVDPGWDPLAFAVAGAHARGLELHAWFNPFRAGNLSDTIRLAPTHFGRRRPDLLKRSCGNLWFDPGEEAVHDHAFAVITDVVRRYDIDAVHLDDFFYPYPSGSCTAATFPDSIPFARYRTAGGTLDRDDWRRDNINRFVRRLQEEVRAAAPLVRVGISPFGIWRPGVPPGITGLDAFATIYADSRLWLREGWVDYLAPQLYWSTSSTGQNFGSLLAWWGQQNSLRRHLWPGLASYRVNDGSGSAYAPSEIGAQVDLVRAQRSAAGGASGAILYNASSVRNDRGGFASGLRTGRFAALAIPPATTWLDQTPPPPPTLQVTEDGLGFTAQIGGSAESQWWMLRWRLGDGTWGARVVPATTTVVAVTTAPVDGVVANAIDRVGNASQPVVWRPE